MNTPTVSVIVANYNRAQLLEQAIQSVIDQTYQDFEIVIFDDGSNDHSFDVIEDFRNKYSKQVKFFTHEERANKGIVATYREAFSKAQGEYVAFLEHDDRWSRGFLEKKVEILKNHPEVGVVFSPYRVVSDGWFGKDMMLRQWLLRPTIVSGKPFDNFPNLLRSNNVATFSCFMTRKSLLEDLPVPPVKILAFDWWVLTRISQRSMFYYDNSSFTLWRWTRQSAIGRQKFEEHKDLGCKFMELMYKQVESGAKKLPGEKQETFRENQGDFAYFLDYYRAPTFKRFWRFFIRAPIWAMAATASLLINFLKFR